MGRRRRKWARERRERRELRRLEKKASLSMVKGWIAQQVAVLKEERRERQGL